jgi:hypothetical protein
MSIFDNLCIINDLDMIVWFVVILAVRLLLWLPE